MQLNLTFGASKRLLALTVSAALMLLAMPELAHGADIDFDVRKHGAKGDGQTNDRAALQSAIDACTKAGGGTVRLPPGDYLSGALRLASDVTLHLEAGATLWASTNRSVTVAHVRGLRIEHLRVEIAESAFRQFDRAAFCGRQIEQGAILDVRRSPGSKAGTVPVIDLKDCRDVTVAGQ